MTVTRGAQPYGLVGQWSVLVEDALLSRCTACPYFEVGFERVEQLSRAVAAAVIAKGSRLAPEEVRFLRNRLGLEAKALAARLGVTASTVSRWENGREPIGATPERLLRALVALAERDNAGFDPSVLEHIEPKDGGPVRLALRRNAAGEWRRVAA
jgi:DNA-binding transcriptional regulator YiaG